MMQRVRAWLSRAGLWIARTVASKRFWYIVLIVFVLQALWFVASARYPMAFDENFHFGLIKLHATQWLPFFSSQPANADVYGDVLRDPSYMYHFLLSLPYRLLTLVTHNEVAQIIVLRLINVAMFVVSLIAFRRILRRLGASSALAHTILAIVVMVPIVPFLAAHINYDNLMILVAAGTLLLTFDWYDDLQRGHLSVSRSLVLLVVMMFGSLVKFAYAPIAAGVGLWLLWAVLRRRTYWPALWSSLVASFRRLGYWQAAGLVAVTLVVGGLFMERYAVNIVQYHDPEPDCGTVLTYDHCQQYSPWIRDYHSTTSKSADFRPNPLLYTWLWLWGMWTHSFFAISSSDINYTPLPVPSKLTYFVLMPLSVIAFIVYGRRVLRGKPLLQMATFATLLYIVILYLQTFQSYVHTGQVVAINGRYLIPVLPIVLLLAGLAFAEWRRHHQALRGLAVGLVLLAFLQGGGVLTFIVQSDPSWDWPNQMVIDANNVARDVLQPVIIGGRTQYTNKYAN